MFDNGHSSETNIVKRTSLRPRSFVKDGRKQIGFIAQEVQEIYPECVHGSTEGDNYLSLDYGSLTAALAAENAALRRRVERLEEIVKRLAGEG